MTSGILGVIDVDFNLGTITIGAIIGIDIRFLISVRLPVEVFFNMQEQREWRLQIGTINEMASALILNFVRARGYLIVQGERLEKFPPPTGPGLPGTAVATGLEAPVILGDPDIRLYVRAAATAHLGITFSPFLIVGKLKFLGDLRLFIVSLSINAEIDVIVSASLGSIPPDVKVKIDGSICGSVHLFLIGTIKGCVHLNLGEGTAEFLIPDLITNVFLQSHAPVLTSGQGGEHPIDASLGDAVAVDATGIPLSDLISVPIDSIPVLQTRVA